MKYAELTLWGLNHMIKKKFDMFRLRILKLVHYIYSEINNLDILPAQTKTSLLINLITIQKNIDKKEIKVSEKMKKEITELLAKLKEPEPIPNLPDLSNEGQKHREMYGRPPIENQWFDTVKEAGAISTATPGFIPRPRYRKRKHDEDIK